MRDPTLALPRRVTRIPPSRRPTLFFVRCTLVLPEGAYTGPNQVSHLKAANCHGSLYSKSLLLVENHTWCRDVAWAGAPRSLLLAWGRLHWGVHLNQSCLPKHLLGEANSRLPSRNLRFFGPSLLVCAVNVFADVRFVREWRGGAFSSFL